MRTNTKNSFTNILDTMTGADGGEKFINLRSLLTELDQRAANNDRAATQLIDIVNQFSKLIEVANKNP